MTEAVAAPAPRPASTPAAGAMPADAAWWALTPQQAIQAQSVDAATGLSTAEADSRRSKFGANKFADAKKEPRWQAFVRQYRDPMQIVLLVAGVLSLFIPNQFATGVVLILLTLLNAAMGLNQEGKAVGERVGPPEDDGRQGQGPTRRRARRSRHGPARPGRHRQHRGGRSRPGRRPHPHCGDPRDRRIGADRRERARSRSRSIRSPPTRPSATASTWRS